MASPTTGNDYLIYVDDESASPAFNYVVVGGQQSLSKSQSQSEVDVTDKQSEEWEEQILGNRGLTYDCEGVTEEADAGFVKVREYSKDKSLHQWQVVTAAGDTITGQCTMSELTEDAPQDSAATFSFSIKFSGEPTFA